MEAGELQQCQVATINQVLGKNFSKGTANLPAIDGQAKSSRVEPLQVMKLRRQFAHDI